MKRSSFIKSLIGLASVPKIAAGIAPLSIGEQPTLPLYKDYNYSGNLFTDLDMAIPDWIPQMIAKYGNDNYDSINEMLNKK